MQILATEETDLQSKKEFILKTCTLLDEEFVECVNNAEKENNM